MRQLVLIKLQAKLFGILAAWLISRYEQCCAYVRFVNRWWSQSVINEGWMVDGEVTRNDVVYEKWKRRSLWNSGLVIERVTNECVDELHSGLESSRQVNWLNYLGWRFAPFNWFQWSLIRQFTARKEYSSCAFRSFSFTWSRKIAHRDLRSRLCYNWHSFRLSKFSNLYVHWITEITFSISSLYIKSIKN